MKTFKKILIANRGEIAIRVMRAANEMGKRTVAVFAEEDKLCLHRFKADEAYRIGEGLGPVAAYLSIPEIIRVAKMSGADAIHPGYGLLSENPDLVDACVEAGITFIGPRAETMRMLGDKASARRVAIAAGVPVIPATEVLPDDMAEVRRMADAVGYPFMLKASWGGGGRGMRPIMGPDELEDKVLEGRREAINAFGNGEGYLEKMILNARHVEVQILGDKFGGLYHLWERDCSVQRRNQKVVERAPAPYLTQAQREEICELGLRICKHANYECAGTVEFLMDRDSGKFYFIEVNPRVQVEHTVTEEVTGIDIVRAQILIAEGATIAEATGKPTQADITLNGNAIQCPDHHRGSAEQLHPRLRPHHRLPRRDRPRHPARRRHRLFRRGDHPLLRLAAREGHRLGADAGDGGRPSRPRAARVPHPRRLDQHRLRREPAEAPDLPRLQLHHQVHRHDARAVPLQEASGPGDQDPDLHRRRDGQRPPRDRRPAEAAGRGEGAARAARARRRAAAGRAPDPRASTAHRPSPTGCWRRRSCSSPTPRCATATRACSPPACGPST